jgi:hypothetical protein
VTCQPKSPVISEMKTLESIARSAPGVALKKPPPSGCFPVGHGANDDPSPPAATETVGPDTR